MKHWKRPLLIRHTEAGFSEQVLTDEEFEQLEAKWFRSEPCTPPTGVPPIGVGLSDPA